jgi:hypothetical protein
MLLISSSEDRYDLSYSRVPAHVLPYSFSGTAVLSWLAPSPAFLYWLLRSSVQKQALQDGESFTFLLANTGGSV